MNKKILFFLALFLSAMLPLRAQTPIQINGLWYNLDNGNHTATVTYPNTSNGQQPYVGFTAPSGDIIIPSSVPYGENDYNVTAIGDFAFFNVTGITSVSFPESITSIGMGSFYRCTSLSTITIPNNVTYIGLGAFESCFFTSVTIPSSVATIDGEAFAQCYHLNEVWLLNHITVPENKTVTVEGNEHDAFDGIFMHNSFYVPFGMKGRYTIADNWINHATRFVEGVLIDGVRYVSTDAPESGVVRYTRTFNSGNWVPLFVPIGFDVSELGGDFQVAELSSVAYNAEGYDVMSWNIVTTVQANHPYIIRYTGTGSYELDHIFNSRTIASSETTAFTSTECNNGGTGDNARLYTLTGTYEEKVYGDGTEWYAMGGGNFWPATTGNSLPAQRFFLTITDPNKTLGQDGYYKSAPQGGTIIRVGEENVGIIRPEGTIMLPADDNYYDLLGRRVEQPQKGNIYIHNHKKIVY